MGQEPVESGYYLVTGYGWEDENCLGGGETPVVNACLW